MRCSLALPPVLLALLAAPVGAQRVADITPAAVSAVQQPGPSIFPTGDGRISAEADAPVWPARSVAARSSFERFAYALGGVVVGTGVGFFAAEVAVSSWDDEPADARRRHRMRYSVGGAALGAVAGSLLGGRSGPRRDSPEVERGPYVAIGPDEISRARAMNAFDLVSALRPTWLRTRGVDSPRETTSASGDWSGQVLIPGSITVVVYLDNARLGGVDELREIPANLVENIDYLDSRAATFRFGSGHSHGAIVVTSKSR